MGSKYDGMEPFGYVRTLLGQKVVDKVTRYEGVVTHIGFDLYGCIQAIVHKEGLDKDGELHKGTWFDVNRLQIQSTRPVMELPSFVTEPEGADNYKPVK